MMIRTVTIEGFKSIFSMSIELGRVNCFIGANGVGKSNILEAIGVLGAAANGVVDDEALLRRGVRPGVPRLYKSSFTTERTPAHIMLSAEGEGKEYYRVSLLNPLDDPEPAWSYKTEQLSDGVGLIVSDGVRSRSTVNPKAGLAALKLVELEIANPAADLMKRLQSFSIYSPNTPTLRSIAPDQQSRSPVGLSGGQLARGVSDLMKLFHGRDEDVRDDLLALMDWVSAFEASDQVGGLLSPSVARTTETLKFTDRFMKRKRNALTAYDASEGALYVLFSALLCLSPKAPHFLAIDNMDQALNPRLLTRLTAHLSRWLQWSKDSDSNPGAERSNRQLLFTAHNPAVLDGLELQDPEIRLFAVDRNSKGHTSVRRIEFTSRLLALNKEYPLSRLWMMGHLGAVPNV